MATVYRDGVTLASVHCLASSIDYAPPCYRSNAAPAGYDYSRYSRLLRRYDASTIYVNAGSSIRVPVDTAAPPKTTVVYFDSDTQIALSTAVAGVNSVHGLGGWSSSFSGAAVYAVVALYADNTVHCGSRAA